MTLEDLLQDEDVRFYAGTVAVVSAVTLTFYVGYRRFSKKPKKFDCPPNTVVLHQLGPGLHAPSLSPFPMKLETFLRVAKIPYKNDPLNPLSKKGKLPWITYNNEDVADSQFSIEYLKEKLGVDLDQNLSSEQKAVATAIRVMVDEHLYWCLVYFRWVYDPNTEMMRAVLPWMFRKLFGRTVKKYLHGQGMGRHSTEEIKSIMISDLGALNDYLGDKPFMMGPQLTEVDCSVFGMLAQLIWHAQDDVCQGLVKDQFPSLYQYCMRVKERAWPDWDQNVKIPL